MKLNKKIRNLATIGLVGVLAGCSEPKPEPSNFVQGEISKLGGNLVSVVTSPEYNGFLSHSNETLKFGNPSYVIQVETEQGKYSIQIDPTDKGGSSGPQTIYNLAETLEVGMKIKFPTELYGRKNPNRSPMGFSKSNIGFLDPDDIEIIE